MKRARRQNGPSRRGFLGGAIATALGLLVGSRSARAAAPAEPLTSTDDPAGSATLPLWIGHL